MKAIKPTTRKEIDLDLTTKKALTLMALDAGQNLQNFIESQLVALGEKGIPYLALWNEAEAFRAILAQKAGIDV